MFSISESVYFLATARLLKDKRNFYKYGQLAHIKGVLVEDNIVTYNITIGAVNLTGVIESMLLSANDKMLKDIGNFAITNHHTATKIQALKNPN